MVYELNTPTSRVIGEIEGGVKIIDQATRVAIFTVIRVVLARAEQRPEDENNVIIPDGRDPFSTGRSLTPKRYLRVSRSSSTISRRRSNDEPNTRRKRPHATGEGEGVTYRFGPIRDENRTEIPRSAEIRHLQERCGEEIDVLLAIATRV